MAYAALVSLSQTIEKIILNHDQYSISLAQKRRILSLDKYVILLQAFLEDFPEKADSLEGRIRDVASEAEDIIQKFMRKKTQSRFKLIKWRVVLAKFKLKHQLKKLRGEIESITKEAMDMTDNSAPIKDDVGTSQKVMDMESNSSTTEDEETQKEMDMESNSSTTEDEEMDMDMDMDMESNSATTEDEETQKEMDMKNNSAIIKDEVEMQKEMDMKNTSVTIKEDVDQLGDFPAGSSSSGLATAGKIDDTVGLDNALIAIQSRLCGQPPELQVIPIVGMGGIGKTTLARKVYNDSLKMHHFDVCVWVTVSQNYSTQEILSGLLISMKLPEQSSIESMAEKVFKNLKRRRYLVVMDDMWSTDAWDDVRNIFPDDSNGSRIILTTRLLDVATYPDSCSPLYEMHSLDQEKSWNLLRQKVFADQKCPKELESIGREIARNCRGLPLAIVVIAGVLSTVTKNPTSWGEIAKNVNSAVTAEHGQVEEILSLSYNHLPHHLRQCFLYLGGFPEDYEIRISKLIKLWVAEGFCQHSNGSQNLEEEAEECLEDLFRRNLVLVSERKSNGKIKSCNLHDLMRDLCIKKAHENKFFLNLVCRNVEKEYCIETLENENRVSVDSSSRFKHLQLNHPDYSVLRVVE